jgi:hypothetical protein
MPSQGREKDLTDDASKKTKSAEELKTEASLLLSFTPDKQLKGLTVFLNSFEKIWKSALRSDNDEITRYVVYHLNWLLAELTQEPSNGLFIEEFLRLLNSIRLLSVGILILSLTRQGRNRAILIFLILNSLIDTSFQVSNT